MEKQKKIIELDFGPGGNKVSDNFSLECHHYPNVNAMGEVNAESIYTIRFYGENIMPDIGIETHVRFRVGGVKRGDPASLYSGTVVAIVERFGRKKKASLILQVRS